MNVGRRARIPPMPVEPIIDNPRYLRLPAAARGMFHAIIYHFWITNCNSLPKSDDELFGIARAHRPTWRAWKAEIMALVAELAPILERARQAKAAHHESLRSLSVKGAAARRALRLEKRAKETESFPLAFVAPKRRQDNQAAVQAKRAEARTGFTD